jgi:nitrite reductase/ring-hydroxylating ferredoxin subunit
VIAQAPVHVLPSQAAQHTWVTLDGVAGLGRGMLVGAGEGLFVANVAGTLLCYRSACAACGETLAEAELEGGTLTCPACARKYDLPRAGRCKDDDAFQLAPVPLLRENGSVRVALTV